MILDRWRNRGHGDRASLCPDRGLRLSYRLLDLGRYPSGHGMDVIWTDGRLTGHLAGRTGAWSSGRSVAHSCAFSAPKLARLWLACPWRRPTNSNLEADTALMLLLDSGWIARL